ncbi:helix-turn-helix domain-containing protein [Streptomyces bohaiensis]|uniref:Transcriptional regulator n=1 Tax=Streptomyces bohaiensis TaxID=1431344 RepID=A0ABX1CER9_9ACTN|nr:helix-turn-helix transcriptional regulator [Streptomyces bohaiensis]NJQ15699.1 transcriptional regulator [Streptomyces bohaiensis]
MNLKELDPDSSPQAAYGALVRQWREDRGWKQDELAGRMEYSSTHLSSIETGRKLPTLRFARNADQALRTEGLFERKWRELRQGSLLEGFPQYVEYEARAEELRLYEIGIIPGLLQTPAYARVLAESSVRRGDISAEHGEERVQFLAERQAALARDRPPTVMAVMDESCIRRIVGGPLVMDEQLGALLRFAELPNTVLQIAPFTLGERRPFNLPINLLTLPDRSLVLYAESQTQGHMDRESTAVPQMLRNYHQLQAEALSQADSVAMIEQVRKGIS